MPDPDSGGQAADRDPAFELAARVAWSGQQDPRGIVHTSTPGTGERPRQPRQDSLGELTARLVFQLSPAELRQRTADLGPDASTTDRQMHLMDSILKGEAGGKTADQAAGQADDQTAGQTAEQPADTSSERPVTGSRAKPTASRTPKGNALG